jgi:hypothetical protein
VEFFVLVWYSVAVAPARVAQLDRASGYEPEGREFESLRAHHSKPGFQVLPPQNSIEMLTLSRDEFVWIWWELPLTGSVRTLAWTQRVAVLGILLFWVAFWADHQGLPANVVDMEWCFLVPDIVWIAAAFWLSSRWLLARDRRAGIATAVAGSSLVYLGLLDAACNLRHGQYTESLSRGVLNGAVNLLCVLFGAANIWYAMGNRKFEDPS